MKRTMSSLNPTCLRLPESPDSAQPVSWIVIAVRFLERKSPILSSEQARMPINGLSKAASCAMIGLTYPSHPSSLRRVTCIKDGFFFCASRFCSRLFSAAEVVT